MSVQITKNALAQPIGQPLSDWQPKSVPCHTVMQGRYCRVVATDIEAHGAALYAAFAKDSEQGNWTYLPYGPFDAEPAFLAWLAAASAGTDPLFHTILDAADRPVGLATYLRIAPSVGVIEVGHIHFSPLIQGTVVATEAMYLMMRRVFDELGYRRYEWKCDALNGPSRSAAERLGFSFEGVFRQAAVYKERNRDTAWFSVIDAEWSQIKAGMEAWLQPENFDPQGRQLRSLRACRDGAS